MSDEDRIAKAKADLDRIYSMLVDASKDVDPVSSRRRVEFAVAELRKLADYLDPSAGRHS